MNAVTTHEAAALMSPEERAEQRESLIDVLAASVYPGAKRPSVALVIAYCEAARLDPLQKPVHIVPMSVKTGTKNNYGGDEYEMRDVIMPGIGLYRTQAARTGCYAGQDEPVIGPMRTMTFESVKREWVTVPGRDKKQPRETVIEKTVEFPEWAQVTVYRLVGGFRVAFVAREYWLENYATAGRDSDAPNSMWERRTIGQLVKCAEAQALRKGFPEVGSQPTAEEMEGKTVIEVEARDAPDLSTGKPAGPQRLSDKTAEQAEAREVMQQATAPAPAPVEVESDSTSAAAPAAPAQAAEQNADSYAGEPASDGERKNVLITAKARRMALPPLLAELGLNLNPETLDGLTKPAFKAIKAKLQ